MESAHRGPGHSSRRPPLRNVVLALLAAAVVGGVIGGLIVHWTAGSSSSGTGQASAGACNAQTVARNDISSVVTIEASSGTSGGVGSGSLIRSGGYVLTNNHVIAVAANGGQIKVLFSDGHSATATIVGRDPLTDLAVIKVDSSDLPPTIKLGASADVQVGQPVIALGAPLGLTSTVTAGIVSAIGRNVQVPGEGSQLALLLGAIQTDAAINPGNSGGALVNCTGDLIGVPTAGASVPNESGGASAGSVGLGFAIPIDLAMVIANELIEHGRVVHAYWGMQVVPLSATVAAANNLPEGLFVNALASGGPAATAGIQPGDVITTIDGQAASTTLLTELQLTRTPGSDVKLGITRDGAKRTVTVKLGSLPG